MGAGSTKPGGNMVGPCCRATTVAASNTAAPNPESTRIGPASGRNLIAGPGWLILCRSGTENPGMRTASLLLAFALLPGSASPQTSGRQAPDASPSAQSGDTQATTAAVASMLRGDYARAAELLEPQVANWQYADATAAFFLGLLYENGLGVPLDKSRA